MVVSVCCLGPVHNFAINGFKKGGLVRVKEKINDFLRSAVLYFSDFFSPSKDNFNEREQFVAGYFSISGSAMNLLTRDKKCKVDQTATESVFLTLA